MGANRIDRFTGSTLCSSNSIKKRFFALNRIDFVTGRQSNRSNQPVQFSKHCIYITTSSFSFLVLSFFFLISHFLEKLNSFLSKFRNGLGYLLSWIVLSAFFFRFHHLLTENLVFSDCSWLFHFISSWENLISYGLFLYLSPVLSKMANNLQDVVYGCRTCKAYFE